MGRLKTHETLIQYINLPYYYKLVDCSHQLLRDSFKAQTTLERIRLYSTVGYNKMELEHINWWAMECQLWLPHRLGS